MTVCLALIARNEQDIIERCIRSCRGSIDKVVLVDTGSSDKTVKAAGKAANRIGVELIAYGRRWQNFGRNRTELLALARPHGDWLLTLDADMTLHGQLPELADTVDQYLLQIDGELSYRLPLLVRAPLDWRYEGVTHEYLTTPSGFVRERLDDVIIEHHCDGSRRPEKLQDDLLLLAGRLREDPEDARAVFYFAQTLRDLGQLGDARKAYLTRAEMAGWDEEAFYAAYQAAVIAADVPGLLAAWERRPQRLEPLVAAARLLNQRGCHHAAYQLLDGLPGRRPDDLLFVHTSVYEWELELEWSVAAWRCGHVEQCRIASARLLERNLPAHARETVERNLEFC